MISKRFMGEDVIIFRDSKTNKVVVTQAHCPHLGGHFDAYKNGGFIKDGIITCPYHHQNFNTRSISCNKKIKIYETIERFGFVLALRQRDPSSPRIPEPNYEFEGVNIDDFEYGTQSFGKFHGDYQVPLYANADYEHFRTVHAYPACEIYKDFEIFNNGNSCGWEIGMRTKNANENSYKPHMGGVKILKPLRRHIAARSQAKLGEETRNIVTVGGYGEGAGLSKSQWYQPSVGLHLLSFLYSTPIDPFTYEVYATQCVKTIRPLKPKGLQQITNKIGVKWHLFANIALAKYDDLPFYNTGKIKMGDPKYIANDGPLKGYIEWHKRWHSDEFNSLIKDKNISYE